MPTRLAPAIPAESRNFAAFALPPLVRSSLFRYLTNSSLFYPDPFEVPDRFEAAEAEANIKNGKN